LAVAKMGCSCFCGKGTTGDDDGERFKRLQAVGGQFLKFKQPWVSDRVPDNVYANGKRENLMSPGLQWVRAAALVGRRVCDVD